MNMAINNLPTGKDIPENPKLRKEIKELRLGNVISIKLDIDVEKEKDKKRRALMDHIAKNTPSF